MLIQLPPGRTKPVYNFGCGPCVCDREALSWLISFLLYISSFSFFLSLSSCFPKVKTVVILKWLQELEVWWNPFPCLTQWWLGLTLMAWFESQSMPAKAHPSTQAIGISVQLLFAWPEETALQEHPGRKKEQAGWWAWWYSEINHQN